jgi:hypothetical protein
MDIIQHQTQHLKQQNTAKFQLNHFFKNTPSSVFNQFKHFLALSLLITFSFNAFSVDDAQQTTNLIQLTNF